MRATEVSIFAVGLLLFSGCLKREMSAETVSDAATSEARPEATQGVDRGPPPDRLANLVMGAHTVVVARISEVRPEARVVEMTFNGYDWRVYYDEVVLQTDRYLGSNAAPTLTVLSPPSRCDAFLGGVYVREARTSLCVDRGASRSVGVGTRILGFVGIPGDSSIEQMSIFIEIDSRDHLNADIAGRGPTTVESIWQEVEEAWGRRDT